MTTPIIKIKLTPKNTVKGKMDVRFPANIATGNFITVTKANGTYTFSVDYTVLTPGPISDPTTAIVAVLDQTAGVYKEVSLSSLLASGLDADLQAIAALTGTGVLSRTADGVWALRTITGTANEITVTNGGGVAGNETLSLPAALTFTGKTITGGTYTGVVSINGNFWTAGTGTLTLGAGKTATISNTLTFTGTDASSVAFGAGGTVVYTSNNLSAFAATTSAQLRGVLSDETGTGFAYFQGGDLGTPSAGVLTSATGLPISTGVSGLATGVATFLATPSSANLRAALTDEVGTGAAYFVGGALGTPASGTLTNATGLPLTGLTAQAAYTIVANATGGSAIPTAMDITALTAKASPVSADIVLIQDSAAANAFKRTTVGALASAGSVASYEGRNGAVTAQASDRVNLGILGRSVVINGQFAIDQRNGGSGPTIADNVYGLDRWRYIGEASAAVFSQSFNAVGGGVYGAAILFAGTTDKGGFFQVIEGKNCKHLRGRSVTLSATILVNNARMGNMKMGIIEWTSTEDATTGDPVSVWGADGVTPTLAANWAFKNTPANLSVTTSAASFSVTATLGSTFNNLAVMIWNDDKVYSANDQFNVSNVQLEDGAFATAFDQRMTQTELALCQRSFYSGVPPLRGVSSSATAVTRLGCMHPVPMRAAPAVTMTSNLPISDGAASSITGITNSSTASVLEFDATGAAGLTAGHACLVYQGGGGNLKVDADI